MDMQFVTSELSRLVNFSRGPREICSVKREIRSVKRKKKICSVKREICSVKREILTVKRKLSSTQRVHCHIRPTSVQQKMVCTHKVIVLPCFQ